MGLLRAWIFSKTILESPKMKAQKLFLIYSHFLFGLVLLFVNLSDLILIDPIHHHTDDDNKQKINFSKFESFAKKAGFSLFSHFISPDSFTASSEGSQPIV